MPDRSTHANVGALTGAAVAVFRAHSAPTPTLIAEGIGGLLGGWIGGIAPDILEPATTPNHRKLAHSAAMGGALMLTRVTEWQASCRHASNSATRRAIMSQVGSGERSSAELNAILWSVLAGILIGLISGYASHLLLDAATPSGLPAFG